MKKIIFFLFIFCSIGILRAIENDDGAVVQRVYKSDGDTRFGFTVDVGSTTAVNVFSIVAGTDTANRSFRTMLIMNPSTNYDLFVATFNNFTPETDNSWIIPSGSSTWSTSNHQNVFIKYPTGMSGTEKVRGNVESR